MKKEFIWGILRIFMGFMFFWAFIDKLFGLGFATAVDKSWLKGASPTVGFLKFATHGPLDSFFKGLAGSSIVDWLFMIGLLLLGLSLMLGIGMKIAGYSGSLLLLLMYLAAMPPKNNPVLDEHIIYILVLMSLVSVDAGRYLGLAKLWSKTGLVKKFPVLK